MIFSETKFSFHLILSSCRLLSLILKNPSQIIMWIFSLYVWVRYFSPILSSSQPYISFCETKSLLRELRIFHVTFSQKFCESFRIGLSTYTCIWFSIIRSDKSETRNKSCFFFLIISRSSAPKPHTGNKTRQENGTNEGQIRSSTTPLPFNMKPRPQNTHT